MGVKGLRQLLALKAPGSIKKIKLADLSGKVIAVDASLYIYKWSTAGGGRIVNSDGKKINHIQGALFNVECMRRHGITPFYVFDGKPPDAKANTIEKRVARDSKLAPAKSEWEEVQELLRLLGVPSARAAGEADEYASAMTKNDTAHAVMTDDLDAFAFGAKNVLLDVDCTKGTATIINLFDILSELGLNHTQFIDMCILMGTDYTNETIKGIGSSRAYARILKYGKIEDVIEAATEKAPVGFNYLDARAVFSAKAPETVTSVTLGGRDPSLKEWLSAAGVRGKRIDNLFNK